MDKERIEKELEKIESLTDAIRYDLDTDNLGYIRGDISDIDICVQHIRGLI